MRHVTLNKRGLAAVVALILAVVVVGGFSAAFTAPSMAHPGMTSHPAASAKSTKHLVAADSPPVGPANVQFNSTETKFTSSFSTNSRPYFTLPYNITWNVGIDNATLAYNNASTPVFQQQLNFTYVFSGCGPLGLPAQQPCQLWWTTQVPFSFHTALTAHTGSFYFPLSASNLTNSIPSTIVNTGPPTTVTESWGSFTVNTNFPPGGPCGIPLTGPQVTGCKNPFTGVTLPNGQWIISLWDLYDDENGNSTTMETDQVAYMGITAPYGQITAPTGNVTAGTATVTGNWSGYFVASANVTVYNSTGATAFTEGVYAPGVASHAFSVPWHDGIPGTYKIVLLLGAVWLLTYAFTVNVTVVPGVPFTYFNSTGLVISGLGAGGTAAFLITLGAIIGIIVMALIGRQLWGGTKPAAAQPWKAAEAPPSTTGPSGGGSGGMMGGSGGGSGDMSGSGGGSSGMGGTPPS